MSKKVTVAIAGLGSRGKDTYAPVARIIPDKMEIVAIADIDREKVEEVAKTYNIPEDRCFNSAEEMLVQDKLADVMFICTQDRQHFGHAIPALKKGYHLLLEKPISPDLNECREIVKVAHETKRQVIVCHVLRYTPFYSKLKEIIDSGIIGEIVSVQAIENVGYWHQAHSFVRGNWRNSDLSSPMILQKCCHDMDILLWLTGKTCNTVTSFGDTYLFKAEKAPAGAALRCTDGCKAKENCPYDAEKIYITNKATGILSGNTGWPLDVLALHPTVESIRHALKTGPYGRCVYHCDNNVVDHQVVNMRMEDGSTISFTMCAFTDKIYRHTKVMGTLGEINADMGTNIIDVYPFGGRHERIDITEIAENLSGHGGGDVRMVEDFIDSLISGRSDNLLTSIDKSVESHFIALAAEQSRILGGKPISMDSIRNGRCKN